MFEALLSSKPVTLRTKLPPLPILAAGIVIVSAFEYP